MNNCESDRVKVWRVIRQTNDDLLEQYTDLYNKLEELLNQLLLCCEDKNDLLQEILNQLDVLIQNLIDCCEAIKDKLDIIIDILIDPIPESLIGYVVEWKDHICEEEDDRFPPESWEIEYEDHTCTEVEPPIPDEYWYVEFEDHICEEVTGIGDAFTVEWEGHTCQQADEEGEWPLIGYELEYIDRVCQQTWECDVTGHLIDIVEDEVIIDYSGQWIDYTCVIEIEHVTTTTTENIPVTTTTTPAGTTTTTTEEPVVVTTTTEEPTTTTTTIFGDCVEYGLLYNWWAATDAKNIAASGWHVPSDTEFDTLISYLSTAQGGKLKETGLTYWNTPNTGATNEVGWNGRGSGHRSNGIFYDIMNSAQYRTTNSYTSTNAGGYQIRYNSDDLGSFKAPFSKPKKQAMSIRLLKDSTSLSHGQTGTYTGNDGKVYKTICIGTQEWLAQNLAETKFRDGSIIPFEGVNPNYFTDAEWAALTTAGVCAYDNNLANVGCDFQWPTE